MWVSPFRNLRINGYLLLPEAYRSLSRLSSALSAKASALCPFCLTICFHHPSVGDAVVDSHCLINKFIDVFLSNVLRLYQGYSCNLSKCTIRRKRLLEACFHKDFLSGLYMRRSRDRGTSVPRCTYDYYTNLHVCSFQGTILTDILSVI